MNRSLAMLILSVLLLAMILIVINRWSFGPPVEGSKQDPSVDFADILRKPEQPQAPDGVVSGDGAEGVRGSVAPRADGSSSGAGGASQPDAKSMGAASDAVASATDVTSGNKAAPAAQSMDSAIQSLADKAAAAAGRSTGKEDVKNAAAQAKGVSATKGAEAQSVAAAKDSADTAKQTIAKKAPVAKQVAEPDAKSGKEPVFNKITKITVTKNSSGTVLTFMAVKSFSHKAFTLKGPDRLVLDLAGKWQKPENMTLENNAKVSKIRPGAHADYLRLVLDLKGAAANYLVTRPSPNILLLTLQ